MIKSVKLIEKFNDNINISQKMTSIQISKKEYDKLYNNGSVLINRLSTGFNHKPSPLMYKKYPKGQYEIVVINPYTKKNEVFQAKVTHEDYGIYIELSKKKLKIIR
jgi:hypothetical protein